MAENTKYISVAKTALAEITEKKSRFICNISHAETAEDAETFIEKIKKLHYNAKHNVYAYILSSGAKKYTDDGEPSKTAGLPILEMLEKRGITDVVCVVTRYFGGILLGTGGLVRAYTEAAKQGLEEAGIVTMEKCSLYEMELPYSQLATAEHMLKKLNAALEDKQFAQSVKLLFSVKTSESGSVINSLSDFFGTAVSITGKGQAYR